MTHRLQNCCQGLFNSMEELSDELKRTVTQSVGKERNCEKIVAKIVALTPKLL